ncbi:2,5-dichloro-2,5-cyclohexadiene-1,4-diol dehydrogenase [Colletotrichum plurivorum]|uniref:2,5-dichloro-2,5-cyclohexadiene-1,4-diol dehydrogenase n=1 Tax=Colletotrichum plurivorum TaxID=2175906 RepID=A0A8H6KB24_9PEZI|nr:2,5-dichloro-2,5-cyclohexadiene-1,4-diol dehydrogenase [Colletotrichum plurivorum]
MGILEPTLTPFKGKVITVAGGSRGTGLATVKYLILRGATVSMSSSSPKGIAKAHAEVLNECPGSDDRVMAMACDITKHEHVQAWIAETINRFGRIDGCANVSGKEQRKLFPLTDFPMSDFKEIMDVNVNGLFHLLREQMKVISPGGSIVNVGSVCSHYSSPCYGAYIASKHAAAGLTKAAAFEGAARNVRVNAVNPGTINSEMTSKPFQLPDGASFTPSEATLPQMFKRMAEPEEIAASVCFLLGDESRFVTKSEWFVDGGWLEGTLTG